MPTIPEALNLALQHHQAGRLPEAEALYRQVLQAQPDHSDALHLLGVIAHQVGQHQAAADLIGRAIGLNPSAAEYHNNMGEVYRALGKLNEAEVHYKRALALNPSYADAYNNLGIILHNQGRGEEAVTHYQQALRLNPAFAEVHCNLGLVLAGQGNLEEAIVHYQHALELKPTFAGAHINLGNLLRAVGLLAESEAHLRQALSLKSEYPEADCNLAITLRDQGKFQEAEASYRRALAINPDNALIHSNLIFDMAYSIDDPETIAEELKKWNDLHARPLATQSQSHENNRNAERCLRVGYVSADFYGHAASYFIQPLLSAHDRACVKVFGYANGDRSTQTIRHLQGLVNAWRGIAGMTDESVVELISSDGIDILVDLSGHTLGNRLLLFARKPAPVQVTYLGSLTSLGMTAMDYRLTDRFLAPTGSPEWCSEKLVRLPGCFLCYQPPAEAPPVASLPASAVGHVTFGSFNNLVKVTPAVITLWSQILRKLPQARLILKDRTLVDQVQRDRYWGLFMDNGIVAERVELLPRTMLGDYLAMYGRVDIGLDPFPYNGCTTTCEALWMGVPVITLAGVMSYGRFGVSLLSNLGLDDLIATSSEAYVEKAVALAKDSKRLAALRAELRPRMAASTLCDAKAFARDVEQAYRSMWRRWCGSRA